MIPSVFVSSTIADLHYLRDSIRSAVVDLAYTPVMSEHGEIGYIAPSTAAESCYRTVKQCQLMVLIIGRRYGAKDSEGFSVTHREFLNAQSAGIPTITFVEADVLTFKRVYDADPAAELWTRFDGMDDPKSIFGLIDSVKNSAIYNGLIPISSAADAQTLLKRQIAHFVGDRITEVVRPLKSELHDVLVDIKGLREELKASGASVASPAIQKNTRALRYLLADNVASLRKFLEILFGDIDLAIPVIFDCENLSEIVAKAGGTLEINEDPDFIKKSFSNKEVSRRHKYASQSGEGYYSIQTNGDVTISPDQLRFFDEKFRLMKIRIQEG